jgi:uncharacterized membrane-anchored protein YhcB (DUF1043 family)
LSEAILIALITGAFSLAGSIIAIVSTTRKQAADMDKKLAVMEAKMDDMKEDIKSHNNYAQMFSENIPAIKQHMTDVDRRLGELERRTIA